MDLLKGAGVGFIVLWVLSALASIGLTVVVILVIIHFVSKYW